MRIAVLGGGVVGLTTAWYLNAAGHQVTLVERQPGPALETSFANGAQISAGHAEPWAQPGTWRKLLRWLPREDAPLLFRLRLDPAQWRWGVQFLMECRPQRFQHNLRQILALGVYSRERLRELRKATGIRYEELDLGILNIYGDRQGYQRAVEVTRIVRELGYPRQPIGLDEAIAREPALAHRRKTLAGATWTPPDETGDAYRFSLALAERCAAAGVTFRFGQRITGLDVTGDAVRGVRLHGVAPGAPAAAMAAVAIGSATSGEDVLACDACVVAMGSHSAQLLRTLGMRINVYPAKGYSATVPLQDADLGPRSSVTDDDHKIVLTRLGERLRVAGTAEFSGYGMALNPSRCANLITQARSLFPGAADYAQARFWTGLRPATPSNRPLIGPTRVAGLYLNTGHGTLGWTEACGSAHALSLLIAGQRPEIDFEFLSVR